MSGVSHHGFSYFVKSSVEHREIWFTLTHTESVLFTGYRTNVLLDDAGGGGGNTNMSGVSHHGFSLFCKIICRTQGNLIHFNTYRKSFIYRIHDKCVTWWHRGGGGGNTNMSCASHHDFSYFVKTSVEHKDTGQMYYLMTWVKTDNDICLVLIIRILVIF